MFGAVSSSTPLCFSPSTRFNVDKGISSSTKTLTYLHSFSLFTPPSLHFSLSKKQPHFLLQPASSSSSFSDTAAVNAEYIEEPATRVKFPTPLSFPGCTDSLTLFGTGYREKVFAIIGVKVYAVGLYLNQSIVTDLNAWKGKSKDVIQGSSSLFNTIFQSPLEKSLQIILVRDVDGKTFWDALSDAISPRIAKPTTEDETALTTFRSVFQDRSLKKGTFIFLTWLNPFKLLISVSSEGIPSTVDATVESTNVTHALLDVFLGESPVSPSLKSSVAESLSKVLE